jgi:ATP-dependent protease ClpP protease subunit
MSDLYNEGRTTTTGGNIEARYETTPSEKEKWFQEFREFDYGLDIRDNVILVQDEIIQGLTFDVISKVRLLRKINSDLKSITILLNSPGGDVVETLGLAAGTGVRAASKHSKIMVHQLSSFAAGKLSDLKSNAKFAEQLEDDCNTIMEECTKKDKKWWEENQQNDYFLSANDALELGIIDKII